MEFIVLDTEFEYRVDANNIIKSVLKDETGNPILRKDLIQKVKDPVINETLSLINNNCTVAFLPPMGVMLKKDVFYVSRFGLLKCLQPHSRIDYKSEEDLSLFSFYKEKEVAKIAKQ